MRQSTLHFPVLIKTYILFIDLYHTVIKKKQKIEIQISNNNHLEKINIFFYVCFK